MDKTYQQTVKNMDKTHQQALKEDWQRMLKLAEVEYEKTPWWKPLRKRRKFKFILTCRRAIYYYRFEC